MSVTVRCPHCFGAKTVMKLGGMMGECNSCQGKGTVAAEVAKPMPKVEIAPIAEVIKGVSNAMPVSNVPPEDAIKVDGKKTLYKRKAK